jgi:hypothetical protein
MSTETIFSEVDEELRRDRMRKLWRAVAPWVIGGAVGVVLLVAGYEGWKWWQDSNSAKWSDQFYAVMETAAGVDKTAAQQALGDLIAQTGGGYPMLAQFRQAALLAQDGKTDEAVAAYDALATTQTNSHLRELALVLSASLLVDKGDVSAVEQRVGGMLAPTSPLRNGAYEMMGLVQYKAGDLDAAMKSFQAIIDDPQANRDLRGRIQVFMSQLIANGAKPIEAESATGAPAVDAGTELDVTPPADSAAASSQPSSAPAN